MSNSILSGFSEREVCVLVKRVLGKFIYVKIVCEIAKL